MRSSCRRTAGTGFYTVKEGLRDNRIESIIIRLGDDSDNSSDDDDLEGVESNAD
mgnify:CR=1 FL=1